MLGVCGELGFKKVLVLSVCGKGFAIRGRYGYMLRFEVEAIQLIRVWSKVFFRSVYHVCQVMQADTFEGFQQAGCPLKSAGVGR